MTWIGITLLVAFCTTILIGRLVAAQSGQYELQLWFGFPDIDRRELGYIVGSNIALVLVIVLVAIRINGREHTVQLVHGKSRSLLSAVLVGLPAGVITVMLVLVGESILSRITGL